MLVLTIMGFVIYSIIPSLTFNFKSWSSLESLFANMWSLKKLSANDIEEFRYNVPRTALDTKIKGISARDIACEILNIAYQSLNDKSDNDCEYILPMIEHCKKIEING